MPTAVLEPQKSKIALPTPFHPQPFILIGLIAWILLLTGLWLKIDHRSPRWDESANLRFAERANHLIPEGRILEAWDTKGALRPNMIPFLSAVSFYVIGHNRKLATFALNGGSLVCIMLVIYSLGTRMFNRNVGLFACVLFNTYASVILWSHYYNLDIPLTAYTALTLWLCTVMIQSKFTRTWHAVALGVVMSLGTCSKHMYAPMVWPPLAWLCYINLRTHGFKFKIAVDRSRALYLAFAAALMAGFGYHVLINRAALLDGIMRTFFTEISVLADAGYVPPKIIDKVLQCYQFQFSGSELHLVLMSIGLAFALWFRKSIHALLYIWVVGIFLIFVLLVKPTMPYYFLPAMPGVAVISSAWLMDRGEANAHFMKRLFYLARIIAALVFSIYFLGFHLEKTLATRSWWRVLGQAPQVLASSEKLTENPFADTVYWNVPYVDGNISPLPYPHYWPVEEMLGNIRAVIDKHPRSRSYHLAYLTNYEWMTGDFLEYKIWQMHLEKQLHSILPPPNRDDLLEDWFMVEGFHFAILKTGKIWKNDHYIHEWAKQGQSFVDGLTAGNYARLKGLGYRMLNSYPLPDGSTGSVWVSDEKMSRFSLLDALSFADKRPNAKGTFAGANYKVAGESRRALYHHPLTAPKVAEISWGITIPPNASMDFGITMSPDTWDKTGGDGVQFSILLRGEAGEITLFDHYIDPKNNPGDRKWHDFQLDLTPYTQQNMTLVLRTGPGPENNNAWDHAAWSGLEIITVNTESGES
ncbi:MAG: glycosyltransferase family 39 protein [Candidatus Omnitrophota bacterium]|nr:glycosyltransferase family 39 protein [Candidatus Omnitrophota bacterium]